MAKLSADKIVKVAEEKAATILELAKSTKPKVKSDFSKQRRS